MTATHACPGPTCRYHIIRRDTGEPACVLHIAADGPMTDDEIAAVLGVTRQAVQQAGDRAIDRAETRARLMGLAVFVNARPAGAPVATTRREKADARDEVAMALLRARPRSPADLVEALGVSRHSANKLLARLARAGRVRTVERGFWTVVVVEVAS